MRSISVIFLLINCYWFCYEAFHVWGVTLGIIDKILMNFQRTTGLFSSILWSKLFCVVFLALSCLGTKGVKEEKITWPKIWTVLFSGFVFFFHTLCPQAGEGKKYHTKEFCPENGREQSCCSLEIHQYLIHNAERKAPCMERLVAEPIAVNEKEYH